jgi:TolB-like protein/class 3 adenylate cyclase/Flp pilus assembly protein TadD
LTGERVERRLAAILAADVEGYSRLMRADEVGTLRGLTRRRAILDGLIASHRGRIANTAGDSVLAEFGSAVDAVQCAVEAQAALARTNADLPRDRHINFRIGVHVGDVIIKGGDLFGDGVNIAARLQNLASAGGVCLSGVAHDQVRKILPLAFTDLGAQQVKNMEEPVRAFAVAAKGALAVAVSANVSMTLTLPDKPSIAVLPFQNMSGDPEQEYFADGMVEDITTGLSRSRSLFVIARNSTFTYRGKAVDIKQVGRELGVRYVLEGSVRKSGNRVRITAQLIDTAAGTHLWADRFDSQLEDIFDLQDRVTGSVIGAIYPQLERAEIERAQRKPTESLKAYDYYLRALAKFYKYTKETCIETLKLTKTANDVDPEFALGYALGADCYNQKKVYGWSSDVAREIAEASELARKAIELDKDDPSVLSKAGMALAYVVGEVEEGAALLERAINLDPNLASARTWRGWTHNYLGECDAAIEQFQTALRLSPVDPRIYSPQTGMAYALFFSGRHEDATPWATLATRQQPNFVSAHRILIAALAASGRFDEARQACLHALQIDPSQRISGIADRTPFRRAADIERLAQAFRIAGMPE